MFCRNLEKMEGCNYRSSFISVGDGELQSMHFLGEDAWACRVRTLLGVCAAHL
jgi:hypothetical protein